MILLCGIFLGGVVKPAMSAYASSVTIRSYPGDGGDSTAFSIGTGAYVSGSVTCAERVTLTGNPCNWSARLYGELAIGYTDAGASFGYNGSLDNEMSAQKFVQGIYGTEIKSFSKSASMFTFINSSQGATTTLYY